MEGVEPALARERRIARKRVRRQLQERESQRGRVDRATGAARPQRGEQADRRIPRLDGAAQREDRQDGEHEQRVEEADDLPRQRVKQEELSEGGPEDPRALRQEPPRHHQFEDDHVGARDDDADADERPHRTVEPGARDPLPVDLERAGPEVEQRDQDAERRALARDQQVHEGRGERHVVLVHTQAIVH